MTDERMTTSMTGGSKGQKLERHDLIPVRPLRALARQYGRGATKYDERNWERGYPWSLSYAAAMRHLTAFWAGEDWDDDPFWENDPPHHLDAAMFHLMAMREFYNTRPEYDDRPSVRDRQGTEKADKTREFVERFGPLPSSAPKVRGTVRQELADSEQVSSERRDSQIQTRRWEIP